MEVKFIARTGIRLFIGNGFDRAPTVEQSAHLVLYVGVLTPVVTDGVSSLCWQARHLVRYNFW